MMNQTLPSSSGTLFVVATPIGNLADLTHRAVTVLRDCDWVACEDTRHSQRVFQEYGIQARTIALHQHNEHQESARLIGFLQSGQHVALVSDAGTPLISDPGFTLLQLAHEAGITVSPIPGPSALTAFLSVVALNTQPFTFHGFIPAKSAQRQKFYESLKPLTATHVFYESSHRVLNSVTQIVTVFGADAVVGMGRELTKKFEHIFRGTAGQLLDLMNSDSNQLKGEFVLAIQAEKPLVTAQLDEQIQSLAVALTPHLPPRKAAKLVAEHYQVNKKKVYEFILSLSAS
ncbi:16S rRNA (cytidine(1402)-2'-O)-methyltransferase [Marinicella sediminis]|uniref:Ribosomal RNA small subunit methyltransferase I n=1 Tax=Marinicella sediminis TaxID=1792834 RepID=A0ABV7J4Q5_9GAMM|nr:16S rRNA (cytidine(1402)-2'-O)-methyltransferase [Marinicella sediminis]